MWVIQPSAKKKYSDMCFNPENNFIDSNALLTY